MAADPIHQRLCKELGKNLSFTRLDELARNALAKGLINQDEADILVPASLFSDNSSKGISRAIILLQNIP